MDGGSLVIGLSQISSFFSCIQGGGLNKNTKSDFAEIKLKYGGMFEVQSSESHGKSGKTCQ